MIGTVVNVLGVVIGAAIGLLLKRGIPARISDTLMRIQGLAIVLIGLSGVLGEMFSVNAKSGRLESTGGLLLLISLMAGCVAGELLRIDDRFNAFGMLVERRFKSDGFAKGFVTASIIFCIGAMAIIGPINEGLTGDTRILYIKSTLDFTTSIVLASVLGVGVLFSSLSVLVVQAIPTLLAAQLSAYITPELLSMFCMVGYSLVMTIGLNFLLKAEIKVANLLPSLLGPILYFFLRGA